MPEVTVQCVRCKTKEVMMWDAEDIPPDAIGSECCGPCDVCGDGPDAQETFIVVHVETPALRLLKEVRAK